MRIVLTGGGTGGHLFPLEPIVEALRDLYTTHKEELPQKVYPSEFKLYFLGVVDRAAKELFANLDVPTSNVPAAKLRRYVSHLTIIDFFIRLPVGIVWALFKVWYIMPDVVVSKGGYGSIPIVLAAAVYRIPVLLHESDAVPGLANRILIRFATTLAISFPLTTESKYDDKIFVTGIPIRNSIGRLTKQQARAELKIDMSETVLLIIGGSQGSQQLNELVLRILPTLVVDTTVLHITGEKKHDAIKTVAQELLAGTARPSAYRAYPFVNKELDALYAAADVIVARAGATTLAELSRVERPALLIPLAGAANDHQRRNAARYEQAGAARVLEPANLGKNLFERSVKELLTDPQLRAQLTESVAQFDRPNAAKDIAGLTLKLASGFVPTYVDANIPAQ